MRSRFSSAQSQVKGAIVTARQSDAQDALTKLISCQTGSCAGMTGSALTQCLGQKCKAAFDLCDPPHHCTVGVASCPAGQECKQTVSGSTQCKPVPPTTMVPDAAVPPATPADASVANPGTPPVTGHDDGGAPPVSEEPGERDSGTTTISDPATGTDKGGDDKSSSGCSVHVPGRTATNAWLSLVVGLAAFAARRRRGGHALH